MIGDDRSCKEESDDEGELIVCFHKSLLVQTPKRDKSFISIKLR